MISLRTVLLTAGWASLTACSPQGRGAWKTLAPIAIAPRQEHATVAISDKQLAIIGGVVPSGEQFNTTALVQLYDIPSNSWSSAAPAPIALNHPNAAVVNGKIYLLGGLADSPDGAWRAIPNSWVYDPATDVWTPVKPIPNGKERGSATMAVHGDLVFLAGGMRTLLPRPGGEQDTVNTVLAYNTASDTWVNVPKAAAYIPEGRDHAAGAVIEDTFYILGGRNRGQHNVRDTVFALDLKNLKKGWKTKHGRLPTARGGLAAGTIGRLVYTFGGEGNPAEGSQGVFNETEVYDTKTDSWKRLPPMAVPRHGTAAVAVGKQVFIPGGGILQGGSPVDVFNAYRPTQ